MSKEHEATHRELPECTIARLLMEELAFCAHALKQAIDTGDRHNVFDNIKLTLVVINHISRSYKPHVDSLSALYEWLEDDGERAGGGQ